jgi:hypothetical protein
LKQVILRQLWTDFELGHVSGDSAKLGYRVTGLHVTELQAYLQDYRVTRLQGYRKTAIQGHSLRGLQSSRATGLQCYRVRHSHPVTTTAGECFDRAEN